MMTESPGLPVGGGGRGMDGGAGGQQRIPEAYQMQENALQEASMGGMRMSGPAAASPHVGGVGSIMQVTQTRRTIFPGTGMMRHVGQAMDYPQQPAEMLQLHTYLRCNTETLLSDRQHYREEVQQQKVMLEQNEAEIRRLKFDIQHERSFTSHLQDKVELYQAMTEDYQNRCRRYEEFTKQIEKIQKAVHDDQKIAEQKADMQNDVCRREINLIKNETREARQALFGIQAGVQAGKDDLDKKFSIVQNDLIEQIVSKVKDIARLKDYVDRATLKTKSINERNEALVLSQQKLALELESAEQRFSERDSLFKKIIIQRDMAWRDLELHQKDAVKYKVELHSLTKEHGFVVQQKNDCEKKFDSKSKELAKTLDEMVEVQSELSLKTSLLEKALAATESLSVEKSTLDKEIGELRADLEAKALLIDSKDADVSEKDTEIRRLLASLTDAKAKAAEAEAELQRKTVFFEESSQRERAEHAAKAKDCEERSLRSIEEMRLEQEAKLSSVAATHGSEMAVLQRELESLNQKLAFQKENNINIYNDFKSKETELMRKIHEQERRLSDMEAELGKNAARAAEQESRHAAAIKELEDGVKCKLDDAVKDTEARLALEMKRKELLFQENMAEQDERHRQMERAAEDELASLRRQHKDAAELAAKERNALLSKMKKDGSAPSESEMERRVDSAREELTHMYEAEISKRDEKHAGDTAKLRAEYERKLKGLQMDLSSSRAELALRSADELLRVDDGEMAPPVIHVSDKIQEVSLASFPVQGGPSRAAAPPSRKSKRHKTVPREDPEAHVPAAPQRNEAENAACKRAVSKEGGKKGSRAALKQISQGPRLPAANAVKHASSQKHTAAGAAAKKKMPSSSRRVGNKNPAPPNDQGADGEASDPFAFF